MIKENLFIVLMLLLAFTIRVQAQEEDIKKHPGYIDLDSIEIPGNAGEVTDIRIGPALLKLARQFTGNGDEKITKSLEGFLSIRVKSFEIDSLSTEKIRPIIEEIEKKLKLEKWEQLVRVKKKDEITNVSIKYDEKGTMQGLLVMSLEPDDEVSFVNIVGKIDMEMLGNLGVNMHTDALDSLSKSQEK